MPRTRPAWLDDPDRVAAAAAKRKATIAAKRAKTDGQAASPRDDLLARIRADTDARIAAIEAERARLERLREAVTQ